MMREGGGEYGAGEGMARRARRRMRMGDDRSMSGIHAGSDSAGASTMARAAGWLWVGLILAIVVWLPLGGPHFGLSWHDQQRIGQVAIFALVAAGMPWVSRRWTGALCPIEGSVQRWLWIVLGLGGISSALARFPMWAFAEMGLMVMGGILGWAVAALRVRHPFAADRVLLGLVFFLCAALSARFLVGYVSVVTSGMGILNPNVLLEGFSNKRFHGQFQALTLPLLVWPLLAGGPWRRWRWWGAALCAVWWAQAIVAGSRGVGLGMAVAMGILAWAGRAGRRWGKAQLGCAAAGFLLYLLLLNAIPAWMDIKVKYHSARREMASLSGRRVLWSRAVEMIGRDPVWGAGPMHFADMERAASSHPHQTLLQWASEWGVPSTLNVLGLLGGAAAAGGRALRGTEASEKPEDWLRVCLSGSVVASAAQAMVDGVLVMPSPSLWLAVISGWLLGLHPSMAPDRAALDGRGGGDRVDLGEVPLAARG